MSYIRNAHKLRKLLDKFLVRTGASARDSPHLIQLDGIGMFDLEAYNQREMIERQHADLVRSVATATDMSVNP